MCRTNQAHIAVHRGMEVLDTAGNPTNLVVKRYWSKIAYIMCFHEEYQSGFGQLAEPEKLPW